MGIPKFFRYISERYPLTSELITPNSIPMFDNLYLDMNGIIHNCTHPPSSEGDASFRLTEQQMVLAIFAYIDHLFSKIKPRKVFFMAVDGVAPRAKMNQQRSRRFRTAQEAKELAEKARRKGEEEPETAAFDSNCITPGTPFMARLSSHLQYFVNKKIAEDVEWRGVEIILSGHDVPGEGEHKIQEYIRLRKAQPNYNPNTRHCLYGLDADLIMLGLLSHDPHFCLLREEVTFGRKKAKSGGLESQNFYLMHLSLLREYLDLEFASLQAQCPFEYSLEKVIDDFILISVFVGNDFLPHLPGLHINEGAMETLWGIYKQVLPAAGGYMNESGKINVQRLQLVLDKLADFELKEVFEGHFADAVGHRKPSKNADQARKHGKTTLTKSQKAVYLQIKAFVLANPKPTAASRLVLTQPFSAPDRRIVQQIAEDLHLDLAWDERDDQDRPIVVATFMAAVLAGTSDTDDDENDETEEDETEGAEALARVLKKWDKAKTVEDEVPNAEAAYDQKLQEEMELWKRGYYKEKLEFKLEDSPKDVASSTEVQKLVYTYIEGLQWVMRYYYAGVASWSWFYPYHYAPRISDLKGVDKMKFEFKIGKPFKPFEQLMGVLPEASKSHIPLAFRDLMDDPNSPILDFYPLEFEADMNGKKQEWEAVVKIPFIDETRLLKAMGDREHRLTAEEHARNGHGDSLRFTYDEDQEGFYPSPIPGFFPDIVHGHCLTEKFELPSLDGLSFITGLLSGVNLGASALAGFPSLQTLPHTAHLGYHQVNVHNSDSKNASIVINIENQHEGKATKNVAESVIGKRIFVGWPFLREAKVVAVSDDLFKFTASEVGGQCKIVSTPHSPVDLSQWKRKADRIEHHYSKRFGVVIGNTDMLLHVRPLKGLKRLDTGAFVKDYEGPERETEHALQVSVAEVEFEDERFLEQIAPKLSDEFPDGERVFFLGEHLYGSAAQVVSTTDSSVTISVAYFANEARENARFTHVVQNRSAGNYYASFELSRRLHVSGLGLSKITSSLMVATKDGSKTNLGLSLKFEGKGLKVMGYSRKLERGWEFSDLAVKLIQEYKATFPDIFANLEVRHEGIIKSEQLLPGHPEPDKRVQEAKKWLSSKGVSSFEPVALYAEQLDKDTVVQIQHVADMFAVSRTADQIKKALVKGLPRQAILKPAHAIYRLQTQTFSLGDRVVMVQDAAAGGVPFSLKGIVIGLNSTTVDVIWDAPFISGGTLGNRCSEYRGASVPFSSCLNLTKQQYIVTQRHKESVASAPPAASRQTAYGARPNNFFTPAVRPSGQARPPVQIMANPQRGAHQVQKGHSFINAAQGVRPARPSPAQTQAAALQATLRGGRPPIAPQASTRPPQQRPPPHFQSRSFVHPAATHGIAAPQLANPGRPVFPAPVAGHGRGGAVNGRGGRGGGRGGRGGRGGAGAVPVPASAATAAPSS